MPWEIAPFSKSFLTGIFLSHSNAGSCPSYSPGPHSCDNSIPGLLSLSNAEQ